MTAPSPPTPPNSPAGDSTGCPLAPRRFTPAPFAVVAQAGEDLRIDTTELDSVEGRIETDRFILRNGAPPSIHHPRLLALATA